MRRKKEFNGKDLNEALAKAATALDIHQDEVHYRFIDEGRRGIMGLGARDVRIEVELPEAPAADRPPQSQPKQERNRRPRRSQNRKRKPPPPKRAQPTSRPPLKAKGGGGRVKAAAAVTAKVGTGATAGPAGTPDRSGNRQPRNGPRAASETGGGGSGPDGATGSHSQIHDR